MVGVDYHAGGLFCVCFGWCFGCFSLLFLCGLLRFVLGCLWLLSFAVLFCFVFCGIFGLLLGLGWFVYCVGWRFGF